MKRIIIFGSSGFIGTNLCQKLLGYEHYELHMIDLKSSDFKHNNCFFYNFDITLNKNKKLLHNIIRDDSKSNPQAIPLSCLPKPVTP